MVIRTYMCIECGIPFESNDDTLLWLSPKCENCEHDDKYTSYGSSEEWEIEQWEDNAPGY